MKKFSILVVVAAALILVPGLAKAETQHGAKKHTEKLLDLSRETAEANQAGQPFRHEVLLTGFSDIVTGSSSRLSLNGNAGTTFFLTAGYNYLLPNPSWLQVGGSIGITASTYTSFQIAVGPTVNFPFDWDARNAFFVDGYLGIYYASINVAGIGASSTNFLFGFDVGKRFKLLDNVTYRPSVGIVKDTGSVQFVLNFISFSAVF
jgi:hypothetical protein